MVDAELDVPVLIRCALHDKNLEDAVNDGFIHLLELRSVACGLEKSSSELLGVASNVAPA